MNGVTGNPTTLWVYLDDSGVYDDASKLRRYALGGGIATFDEWQRLKTEWVDRLKGDHLSWFHYKEWKRAILGYAKKRDQFAGWSRERLLVFLGDLTRIVSKHEVHYLCTSVRAVESKRQVRDSYIKVATNAINRAQQIAERTAPDATQISFVFSDHAELAGGRIQHYWERLRPLNEFHGRCSRAKCLVHDPRTEPLLQVADLIANEMATSRFIQVSWGPTFRTPHMTKIMQVLKREPPYHHMIEFHDEDHETIGS